MTGPYAVDPAALSAMGGSVGDEGDAIASAVAALNSALSGSGAMFGHDAPGIVFGNSYTQAGKAVLDAVGSAVNACRRVGCGVQTSAANYGRANAASTVGGGSSPVSAPTKPSSFEAPSMPPPMGSGVAEPLGWSLVEAFVGEVWPDGNPAALRLAAGAWRTFGATITGIASQVIVTAAGFGGQQIPEAGQMSKAITDISNALIGVAGQAQQLATQVEGFAATVDATQNAVRGLLEQLSPGGILETVGGIFTGHNPIDKIKQVASEVKTVLDNMKREADASSQLFSQGINVLDSLTGDFQAWAKKEFVDVFGEEVGNPLGTVFNAVVGANKSGLETVLRTVHGFEDFDPTRFAYDPEGALNTWNHAGQNVADMANPAALAAHMATDPQGVLNEAKSLVDYDDWAKGHYADAVGNIGANLAMTLLPGGAGAKPAVTAAEMEGRAASAAAQAEERAATGGARDAVGAATHTASATDGITKSASQIGSDLDKITIPESGAAPASSTPTGRAPIDTPPAPEAPHTETPAPRADAPAPHAPAESAPRAPEPSSTRVPEAATPHEVPARAAEPAPVHSDVPAPRTPEPAPVSAAPAEGTTATAPHASAPIAAAPAEMPAAASQMPHATPPPPGLHATPTEAPHGAPAEAPHTPPAERGSSTPEHSGHDSPEGSHHSSSDHRADGAPHDGNTASGDHDGAEHANGDLSDHSAPDAQGPAYSSLPDYAQQALDRAADNATLRQDLLDHGVPPEIVDSTAHNPYEGLTPQDIADRHYTPEGRPNWPRHDGFLDGEYQTMNRIPESAHMDRIGEVSDQRGDYMATQGDSYPSRGLAPGSSGDYNLFQGTDKQLPPGWELRYGEVGPAFEQPGGGTQWVVMDDRGKTVLIDTLLKGGYLKYLG